MMFINGGFSRLATKVENLLYVVLSQVTRGHLRSHLKSRRDEESEIGSRYIQSESMAHSHADTSFTPMPEYECSKFPRSMLRLSTECLDSQSRLRI